MRNETISGDKSPDIEWVKYCLGELSELGNEFDAFSILRPTSPFRMPKTIVRAWECFCSNQPADSLRAVEKCSQHPGKMWVIQNKKLLPIMPYSINGTPWHSSQYAALPDIYVQNASLEIAWTKTVKILNTIAGESILSFETRDYEGFDINTSEDWLVAEILVKNMSAELPSINIKPFPINSTDNNGVDIG